MHEYLGRSGETWHFDTANTSSALLTLNVSDGSFGNFSRLKQDLKPQCSYITRVTIFSSRSKIHRNFMAAVTLEGVKSQWLSLYKWRIIILAFIIYQAIVSTRSYFDVAPLRALILKTLHYNMIAYITITLNQYLHIIEKNILLDHVNVDVLKQSSMFSWNVASQI